MSERVIVSQSDLTAIADAIRSSTGTTSTFNVPELSERAVNLIENWTGAGLPDLSNPGTAAHLLKDKQLINEDGEIVTGTMANNGAIEMTMDGIDTKSVSIPAGYISGGTVSLDGTIDEEVEEQSDLIAQIKNAANNLPDAGDAGVELISVTCNTLSGIYYFNSSCEPIEFRGHDTVSTLGGIIMYVGIYKVSLTGEYTIHSPNHSVQIIKFKTNGGSISISSEGSGSDD